MFDMKCVHPGAWCCCICCLKVKSASRSCRKVLLKGDLFVSGNLVSMLDLHDYIVISIKYCFKLVGLLLQNN